MKHSQARRPALERRQDIPHPLLGGPGRAGAPSPSAVPGRLRVAAVAPAPAHGGVRGLPAAAVAQPGLVGQDFLGPAGAVAVDPEAPGPCPSPAPFLRGSNKTPDVAHFFEVSGGFVRACKCVFSPAG
jgi:hypothetical protein